MTQTDLLKLVLVTVNGFAGFVAAYPGSELAPLARLFCAALVVGCGGGLLFLDKLGGKPRGRNLDPKTMTAAQRKRLALELREEMEARPAVPHG